MFLNDYIHRLITFIYKEYKNNELSLLRQVYYT